MTRSVKFVLGLTSIILLVFVYLILSKIGVITVLMNSAELHRYINQLGLLGPVAVIFLMTLAVVISPIPSAPIALAAGAAYGHTWGTIYIIIGAETGALIAFYIARLLGYDIVQHWFKQRLPLNTTGSQNSLMLFVFVSRLIPFISFDIVSYAAGLTPLSAWRFILATLAGITPASFLLAHFGGELSSENTEEIILTVFILGFFMAIPFVIKIITDHRKNS